MAIVVCSLSLLMPNSDPVISRVGSTLNFPTSLCDLAVIDSSDFPTFLKSDQGPVDFGKKVFGASKLGKLDAV